MIFGNRLVIGARGDSRATVVHGMYNERMNKSALCRTNQLKLHPLLPHLVQSAHHRAEPSASSLDFNRVSLPCAVETSPQRLPFMNRLATLGARSSGWTIANIDVHGERTYT